MYLAGLVYVLHRLHASITRVRALVLPVTTTVAFLDQHARPDHHDRQRRPQLVANVAKNKVWERESMLSVFTKKQNEATDT